MKTLLLSLRYIRLFMLSFSIFLLVMIVYGLVLNKLDVFSTKERTLTDGTVPDRFDIWMEDFKNEQLVQAAAGEKALANPFDESRIGIPSNEELLVLAKRINDLGFTVYVNKTTEPNHFTATWD